MSNGNWSAMPDDLVAAMRAHVQNLNERVAEASSVLEQSREVNEKIAAMREYKDETNAANGCFRSKDRTGLVRGLQSENRQIRQLQEENRQMKLALEDVQRGMGLIMEKHRTAVRDFERSNALFELVQRRFDLSQQNNTYEKRFYELADHIDGLLHKMGEQQTRDLEKYAAVCAENAHLRQALAGKGAKLVPKKADEPAPRSNDQPSAAVQPTEGAVGTADLPPSQPPADDVAETEAAADTPDSTVVQPTATENVAQVETDAPQTNVD